MTAKVIFSDGSKAMARNLDDLRERWMLRRQELASVGVTFEPLNEPNYSELTDLSQVEALRRSLIEQVTLLYEKKQAIKRESHLPNFSLKLAELNGEYSYKLALSSFLKYRMGTLRVELVDKLERERWENMPPEIRDLKRALSELASENKALKTENQKLRCELQSQRSSNAG